MARFALGLGQSFGLFGSKMPLVPEGAGEPERVEQKRVHGGTMRRRAAKVQRRAVLRDGWFRRPPAPHLFLTPAIGARGVA